MNIYYIKLGVGGCWEEECIKGKYPTIRLWYKQAPHEQCLKARKSGDWDPILRLLIDHRNGDVRTAKNDLCQITRFYTATEDDIWITFYGPHMYWGRADQDVSFLGADRSKTRKILGRWSSTDKNGKPLTTDRIAGSVLAIRGFKGTNCNVHNHEYVLRLIEGTPPPEIQEVTAASARLVEAVENLIKLLEPKDLEVLVDLVFREGGWQRMGQIGGTQKDIDIDLLNPWTAERVIVQVKARATQKELNDFRKNKERTYATHEKGYFVFHTGPLKIPGDTDIVEVWDGPELANRVVSSGLVDWVVTKLT